MASGSIQKRCKICRREGLSGRTKCTHREAVYFVCYRVGKRQKSEKIGVNKKDAEKRLIEVLSSINNGTYSKPSDVTFKEFAYKWLADYARSRIKQRTHTTYESIIRTHLLSSLGNILLTDLTQQHIESTMAILLKMRKARTVNKTLKLLKTILKYARRWKYIKESPALDIDSFREEHEEMDFLNVEEINLLLKHSTEPYRTLFLTAILSGMRRSEILALQWGDVDWHSDTIFVRRSLFYDSKMEGDFRWRFDTPKTRGSVRAIAMSPKLKEALEMHRLSSPESPYDLVFCNRQGSPLDPDNMVKREFLPALSFAGLRRITFHSLRHAFASLLIAQGENIKFIQGQLGHASCQTTLDRYGHIMPINYRGVGERLDANVFGVSDNTRTTEYAISR